jgi:hypothetical protein
MQLGGWGTALVSHKFKFQGWQLLPGCSDRKFSKAGGAVGVRGAGWGGSQASKLGRHITHTHMAAANCCCTAGQQPGGVCSSDTAPHQP